MRIALIVSVGCVCILVLLMVVPLSPWGFVTWTLGNMLLHKSPAVKSVPSPDGQFEAYVVEEPSIDPPNQSLYIQRADKTRYMFVAKLAEDVNRIEDIVWSPDGAFVVFRSYYYLTATRVSDWMTVRIYLGDEWMRSQPSEFSTFSTPSPRNVEDVSFPEKGAFSYRLRKDNESHVVRFAA